MPIAQAHVSASLAGLDWLVINLELWARTGAVAWAKGVVANFRCEKPHRNTAFQWFRPDGVLA